MHIIRSKTILATSATLLLSIALAGAGCGKKQPPPVFNAPPAGSPSVPVTSNRIRAADAPVNMRMGEMASTNGQWQAYAKVAQDKTLTMTVEGPSYKKEFTVAAPVSFSPDSRVLIFSSDGGYGTLGIYVLRLQPRGTPRRITNTVKIRSAAGKSLLPVPWDSFVTWHDNIMQYTVPDQGTYELDLQGETVKRIS